ncbi:MAG: SDR family NAD(P)-dependent oxidoreductase [Desulfomonilaceae bacterium]
MHILCSTIFEAGKRVDRAISSLTGKARVPTRSAYAASKHAMVGFFDSIRIEIAQYGVDVSVIYPDFVSSEARESALGPDGQPLGTSPVKEKEVMSVEICCEMIIKAMVQRERELIMTFRGRIGQGLKLVAPAVVYRIALRAIQKGL